MNYPPHGACWLWNEKLIALHGIFDFMTFTAYMLIPLLFLFIYKKGHLKGMREVFPGLWQLGALFILFCGFSHLGSFFEIWVGGNIYWITGINKMIMGVVSYAFFILLVKRSEKIIIMAEVLRVVIEKERN